MRSTTLTIADGASCAFPREAYKPADLTGEQHVGLREGLYRTARYDGLDEEAAEEAASQFYLHWLARDYSKLPYARGDHMRAYYAIRAYARRSQWRGFTGQRRAKNRQASAEMLAMRERRLQSAIPRPDALTMARETVERMPNGPIGRRLASLSRKQSAADLLATAYGADSVRPTFNPAPVPSPSPLTAQAREARETYRPMGKPATAVNVEAYREALTAHYETDRPLISGDPRRVRIVARWKLRAMVQASR
jgi:hypothetical protein